MRDADLPDELTQPTLLAIGPSHHTASVAARERFALVGSAARALSSELWARDDVDEIATLATCNRSEIYVVTRSPHTASAAVTTALADLAEVGAEDVRTIVATRVGDDAMRHVLRVASGLESVVLGEAQIQGQIRSCLESALEAGTCGAYLDRVLRAAIEVGKRVRRETAIGAGRASVGSIAAELLAGQLGGALEDSRVVVVGAGKMGSLAARSIRARGVQRVDVANRTADRARRVAAECGGDGIEFEVLDDELVDCDAVVTSTDAPHVLISAERLSAVMERRGGRPLVVIDLAVPRDVEGACAEIDGVRLYDLDDLEQVVATTVAARRAALGDAEGIAEEAAAALGRWWAGMRASQEIRQMRDDAERIRGEELARHAGRLAQLSPRDRELVERITRSVTRRVMHERTVRLREDAQR